MGQNQTVYLTQDNKPDVVCEIFTQTLLHAAEKVKGYLGFQDPQQKLYVSTRTLNEVFLMSFINFCKEKGVEDRISTSKMTKQQEVLLGVDWIWTLTGGDKQTLFQIAVQTVQLGDTYQIREMDHDPYERIMERSITDLEGNNKSRYEKLQDFCTSIGTTCTGLVIVYGVQERNREIRGVLVNHLLHFKDKKLHMKEEIMLQYLKTTDFFITVKEMMENYICNGKKSNSAEQVYIHFL
uniref:Rab15 effector protein-like n=1 Tax=Geotrypetes seraphini TaxID=260995 RepID=A0A6P8NSQ3_GEOSA|nr:rab15 effector protein-like [Geotrypetes seraphini]XP_033773910.1 rab15 effector protein-like [Geotrypetes seraphini]XP_033773911.1 rab15 effector protein-like [Geotrypetes seraphini]